MMDFTFQKELENRKIKDNDTYRSDRNDSYSSGDGSWKKNNISLQPQTRLGFQIWIIMITLVSYHLTHIWACKEYSIML